MRVGWDASFRGRRRSSGPIPQCVACPRNPPLGTPVWAESAKWLRGRGCGGWGTGPASTRLHREKCWLRRKLPHRMVIWSTLARTSISTLPSGIEHAAAATLTTIERLQRPQSDGDLARRRSNTRQSLYQSKIGAISRGASGIEDNCTVATRILVTALARSGVDDIQFHRQVALNVDRARDSERIWSYFLFHELDCRSVVSGSKMAD